MAGERIHTASPQARQEFRVMQKRMRESVRSGDDQAEPSETTSLPKAIDIRTNIKIIATNPSDANVIHQAFEKNPDIAPYPSQDADESTKGK